MAVAPSPFPFFVTGTRSLRDAERAAWQTRLDATVEFQIMVRNIIFGEDGTCKMPAISIDPTKIPKYPRMASLIEYVPRSTLHQLMYYCQDATRPLPGGRTMNADTYTAVKAVYAALDPTNDLLRVAFEAKNNIGRYYATYDKFVEHITVGRLVGSSLSIPKYLRASMWAKHGFIDLDQRKSHPTLLVCIASLFGIPTPALHEYLTNTEACLDALAEHWTDDPASPITRSDTKRLINRTVYGGGLAGWIEELRTGKATDVFAGIPTYSGAVKAVKDIPPHDLYRAIKAECVLIMDLIYVHNKDLLTALNAHKSLQEHQLKRKVLSFFCQCIEHHITYTALEFCAEHGAFRTTASGAIVAVWGYDGLSWVPPRGLNPIALTEELNAHLHAVLGPAFRLVEFVLKATPPEDCIAEVMNDDHTMWRSRSYTCDFEPMEEQAENPYKLSRTEELNYWADQSYDDWKDWFERCHFKVEDPTQWGWATYNSRGGLVKVIWYSVEAMKTKYHNSLYYGPDDKGVNKRLQAIPRWLKDPKMRVYSNMENYPRPLICPSNTFNTWTESPLHYSVPSVNRIIDEAYVADFLKLQSIACGYDADSEKYFTYWNADWIQRPAEKSGVIPIIVGTEGTGKSCYANILLKLAGAERGLETTIENVVNTFNALLEGKLLVVLNELNGGLDSAQNAIFKQLLTDSTVTINGKGRPQYTVKSYHRFLGTSNFPNVMDSDRRPFYVRSAYDLLLPENADFLNRCWSMANNDRALGAIYRYFLNLDMMETFGATRLTPPNNALNREFKRNRQPYAQFAWHLVDMYVKPGVLGPTGVQFTSLELHNMFHDWLLEQKIVAPVGGYGSVMTSFVGSISWPAGCISNPIKQRGSNVEKRLFNFLTMKLALEILYPRTPDEVWQAARVPDVAAVAQESGSDNEN